MIRGGRISAFAPCAARRGFLPGCAFARGLLSSGRLFAFHISARPVSKDVLGGIPDHHHKTGVRIWLNKDPGKDPIKAETRISNGKFAPPVELAVAKDVVNLKGTDDNDSLRGNDKPNTLEGPGQA